MRYLFHICLLIISICILSSCSHFIIPWKSQISFWGYLCDNDYQCGHGYCQEYICRCYQGFLTWKSMYSCMYEQRMKLRAFFLSFFLGIFGIDWFYLSRGVIEYIIIGIIKLLITFTCIIGWLIFILKISKMKRHFALIGNMINVIFSLTSFLWWLTDWIRILANVFYDGHGAPLQTSSNQRIFYRI